ncbi:MAG: aminoacyl-tRNA hydrolase [Gammaproteobacteria bacterium]
MAENPGLSLIVGLGNPGVEYAKTRHNAGIWLVDKLAEKYSASFRRETRFKAHLCRIDLGDNEIWLLKPDTYMNESGPSVAGCAAYYKIEAGQTLVAHDELGLGCGKLRLKRGGGHGGHNGLRDIASHLNPEFARIRIGIGRPTAKQDVARYVLNVPRVQDQQLITAAISVLLEQIETVVTGDLEAATKKLGSHCK